MNKCCPRDAVARCVGGQGGWGMAGPLLHAKCVGAHGLRSAGRVRRTARLTWRRKVRHHGMVSGNGNCVLVVKSLWPLMANWWFFFYFIKKYLVKRVETTQTPYS
jgi:hypothetical protein